MSKVSLHKDATPDRTLSSGHAPVQPKLEVGEPNDQYEKEADAVADKVVATPPVQMMPGGDDDQLQLQCDDCGKPAVQLKCDDCDEKVQMMPEVQASGQAPNIQLKDDKLKDIVKYIGKDEGKGGFALYKVLSEPGYQGIDTIKTTEEYKLLTEGEGIEGLGVLTEAQALRTCVLMLRDMKGKATVYPKVKKAEREKSRTNTLINYATLAKEQVEAADAFMGMEGDQAYWTSSSIDKSPRSTDLDPDVEEKQKNYSDFRTWAIEGKAEELPDKLSEPYTLNCWEAVLFGAVKAGVIDHSWVQNMYTQVDHGEVMDKIEAGGYEAKLKEVIKISLESRLEENQTLKAGTVDKYFAEAKERIDAVKAKIDRYTAIRNEFMSWIGSTSETQYSKANGIWSKLTGSYNLERRKKKAEGQLSSGAHRTYWARNAKPKDQKKYDQEKPLKGDIVYFNGLSHVAMATGKNIPLGNGKTSPEIITFWPPPDQGFFLWNYSTTKLDSVHDRVKKYTIDDLLNWGEDRDKKLMDLPATIKKAAAWKKKAVDQLAAIDAEAAKIKAKEEEKKALEEKKKELEKEKGSEKEKEKEKEEEKKEEVSEEQQKLLDKIADKEALEKFIGATDKATANDAIINYLFRILKREGGIYDRRLTTATTDEEDAKFIAVKKEILLSLIPESDPGALELWEMMALVSYPTEEKATKYRDEKMGADMSKRFFNRVTYAAPGWNKSKLK